MTTCRECVHWKPIPDNTEFGDCFGHQVPANAPVDACPAKAFQPRQ